jgi:hypothetical protein
MDSILRRNPDLMKDSSHNLTEQPVETPGKKGSADNASGYVPWWVERPKVKPEKDDSKAVVKLSLLAILKAAYVIACPIIELDLPDAVVGLLESKSKLLLDFTICSKYVNFAPEILAGYLLLNDVLLSRINSNSNSKSKVVKDSNNNNSSKNNNSSSNNSNGSNSSNGNMGLTIYITAVKVVFLVILTAMFCNDIHSYLYLLPVLIHEYYLFVVYLAYY